MILGQSFQQTSMNSSTPSDSTLVGWMPSSKMPTLDMKSCFSLRSEQKTSGLFDTENVDCISNSTMTNTILVDMEDDWKIFDGLGDDINLLDFGLSKECPTDLGDISTGLSESDFLDSFIDLSNFVTENISEKKPDESAEVFNTEATSENRTEFPSVIEEILAPTFSTIPADVGKRKRPAVETVTNVGNVVDVNTYEGVSTSDHDYVSKKPRLSPVINSIEVATASSSKVCTNEKYRDRRDKNNVASKRSREIRKMKYKEMEKTTDELVIKNDLLRIKIVELEKLAKEMKATLISKMTAH